MCRHLGYLGPACAVGELLTHGPHSLQTQSFAPRDMRGGGTLNADGYGAAWWAEAGAARYRSAAPMWTDRAGVQTLSAVRSTAVLAAVRSATVGMPVVATAAAPFTDGHWAFSHNGVVRGWPHSVAPLAQTLPITDLLTLDAPTDSALLWAALRHRLAHADAADAVAGLVLEVAAAAPGSRLNLLLGDGEQLVATTWEHALSYRVADDAVVLASEPWDDDPAWQSVPDRSLVRAKAGSVTVTPLMPAT
ncbi:ergothioneine biosynthesis protein EgtC [Rhodococcus sp. X156]|uniref:ergothioneine biosynthesis protein EgtC n=1 Tax=Rhodococcus sp. X156 TaxID=2499145 RepID=UPI000FDA59A0|nr:ergothioneine biosynthesis protein EgtC [Rhodococcus sp. X156]